MSGNSQVSGIYINSNFPVPGQNNTSQGFRDNFHAIKTALNRTGIELTELRQNAVLRHNVRGLPSTSNDYNYSRIVRPQLRSFTETFFDLGDRSGSFLLDLAQGTFQKVSAYRDISISRLVNVPGGAQVATFKLWFDIKNPGVQCFLPDNTLYGLDASFIVDSKIVFPRRGNYILCLSTVDNGRRVFVYPLSGLTNYRDIGQVINRQLISIGILKDNGSLANNAITTTTTTTNSLTFDLSSVAIASPSTLGLVKIDGNTIGIRDGVISVIGGTGGSGLTGNTGATGATGPPGVDSVIRTGSVYSYMYEGYKNLGNQTGFHLVTLTGIPLGGNGTLELTLCHHHSVSSQTGAYRRVSYAIDSSTNLLELENYSKTFDAGTPTGNIGFDILRPTSGNIEIRWLGNVSFDPSYSFYMTVQSNFAITIEKIGLD